LLPNCCRCSLEDRQVQCGVGDFLRSSFSLPSKRSGPLGVVAIASPTPGARLTACSACWYARAIDVIDTVNRVQGGERIAGPD
jgi:hypothetical protein